MDIQLEGFVRAHMDVCTAESSWDEVLSPSNTSHRAEETSESKHMTWTVTGQEEEPSV